MATFLDLSLFSYFGSIFVFIFVFALTYGILSKLAFFKSQPGEKGIYGLIAMTLAFLMAVSKSVSTVLSIMTPWFAVILIFLFFIMLMFSMFTGDDTSMMKKVIHNPGVYWTLVVVGVIIFIASLSSTFGQQLLEDNPEVAVNIDTQNELATADTQQADSIDTADTTNIAVDYTTTDYDSRNRDSQPTTNTVGGITPGAPGSTATDDYGDNFLATLIHPKIMGMIMLMFIAFFAVLLLASSPDPN